MGTDGANRICLDKASLDAGRWQSRAAALPDRVRRAQRERWKWHSTCTAPASTSDGEAVFANAENYTVRTTSTYHLSAASARTTQMTIKAKWVGANCGDLKPVDPKSLDARPVMPKR